MDTSPLRIGYCLSLSGALLSNGKTARLAHQIWQEHVNTTGGLLGRPVELVCLDDQTNPRLVADLYQHLLDVAKVDVVVGGYGDNSVAPAMPLKAELGALLNGLVNYEYWLPVPSLMNPQIESLIATYQSRAEKAGADPLGYYVAPLAYAQMQVLEQAIRAVRSADDAALSDYTRTVTFETVVGKVAFGEGGGWAQPRVLTVQFQKIKSNNISEFKRPDTQAVVYPPETASATVIYPYANAKRLM
jgi:ABC-type branched-subunit amino acid transport system substrate-binding protein